jgi:hypothetical protein
MTDPKYCECGPEKRMISRSGKICLICGGLIRPEERLAPAAAIIPEKADVMEPPEKVELSADAVEALLATNEQLRRERIRAVRKRPTVAGEARQFMVTDAMTPGGEMPIITEGEGERMECFGVTVFCLRKSISENLLGFHCESCPEFIKKKSPLEGQGNN